LKRDYKTGQVWDTGHRLLREKAQSGLHTGIPSVDSAIARIVEDFKIDDPGAYLLCNRSRDGRAFIAPHQHDFWSATFSFGAPRVFLLDRMPLVLEDGDVLIFGNQRHSVPKMLEPNPCGERISLSLFWHPSWRTDCDYSEYQLERWCAEREQDEVWAATRASATEMLCAQGFDLVSVILALNDAKDDVNEAAAVLLAKVPAVSMISPLDDAEKDGDEAATASLPKPTSGGRWRRTKSSAVSYYTQPMPDGDTTTFTTEAQQTWNAGSNAQGVVMSTKPKWRWKTAE
jgi:hypothetical protein